MIVTDEKALRLECSDVLPEEIAELREALETELEQSEKRGEPGLGLAAPQIGIHKRMAIIRMGDTKIDLVNASIALAFDEAIFKNEGCLSFPGRTENTKRHKEVHILDNVGEPGKFIATGLLAVVVQHECLPHDAIIQTEHGSKRIIEIVNEKYDGKIWCLGKDLVPKLSHVIGWRKNKNINKKKWVRVKLSTTGPNKQLKCTEDHVCAFTDNIMINPVVGFTEAKNLTGKYIIRKPIFKERNSEVALYNSDQMSAIVGGLLGDLCIASSGEIIISHGEPQKEYANYKANILDGYVKPGYSGYRDKWSNVVVHAPITEQTKLLRTIAYPAKKRINKELLPYINDIALAFWYMDDGCFVKNKYAQFHTEGFYKKDLQLLREYLKNKFKIKVSISHRKVRSKLKYYLRLDLENSQRLFDIIHPYVIRSMEYKVPQSYRNGTKVTLSSARLGFSVKRVTAVDPVFKESYLYDIEVEGDHNFFANNTLVHNCDHLRGVLLSDVAISEPPELQRKKKLRPNDQCLCGSGLKYKKCCSK